MGKKRLNFIANIVTIYFSDLNAWKCPNDSEKILTIGKMYFNIYTVKCKTPTKRPPTKRKKILKSKNNNCEKNVISLKYSYWNKASVKSSHTNKENKFGLNKGKRRKKIKMPLLVVLSSLFTDLFKLIIFLYSKYFIDY